LLELYDPESISGVRSAKLDADTEFVMHLWAIVTRVRMFPACKTLRLNKTGHAKMVPLCPKDLLCEATVYCLKKRLSRLFNQREYGVTCILSTDESSGDAHFLHIDARNSHGIRLASSYFFGFPFEPVKAP
jgi:hypothetical protein